MDLRENLNTAVKEAMKARDAARLSTLRMIGAAIKDREIEQRATGAPLQEPDILQLLAKMIKQRQESARVYSGGGRPELADKELAEIQVIEGFLPRQLSADEVAHSIDAAITDTGATSLRDMGKVMAVLKAKYTGQMDFGAVGALIKTRLG